MLFQLEERDRALVLAIADDAHLVPRVWEQQHVAQVPVVFLLADAAMRRQLALGLFEPCNETIGSVASFTRRLDQTGMMLRCILREPIVNVTLDALLHDGEPREIAARVRQISPGLIEDGRNRTQLGRERRDLFLLQR